MKIFIPLLISAAWLALHPNAMATEPHDGQADAPPRAAARRPSDHWLENMRQKNPDEFRRLHDLREADPDSFAGELRTRIQARAIERLMDESPRFREFFNSLPPEERAPFAELLRRFAAGDARRIPPRREIRTPEQQLRHPPDAPPNDDGFQPPRENAKPETRADLEAAYDRRTQMIEQEIDRISRQLENLRRLAAERREKRDRVIESQTTTPPARRKRNASRSN